MVRFIYKFTERKMFYKFTAICKNIRNFLLHFQVLNKLYYPLQVRCKTVIEVLHCLLLTGTQIDLICSHIQRWSGQRSGDATTEAWRATKVLPAKRQRDPWAPQTVHDQSTRGTSSRREHTLRAVCFTAAMYRHGWARRSVEVRCSSVWKPSI